MNEQTFKICNLNILQDSCIFKEDDRCIVNEACITSVPSGKKLNTDFLCLV